VDLPQSIPPPDRLLLGRIEARVPLVREPYAQIASETGLTEAELLAHLAALRSPGGIVREISGVFDAPALGYEQALVALAVPPERRDRAGRAVAAHPGVSHAYGRSGTYNLWFTLACSPASRLGLDATAGLLAEQCQASRRLLLPALRRYKLHVRLAGADPPTAAAPVPPRRPPELTDAHRRAIRALQDDLPNRPDPFAPPAERASLDPDMLLVLGADFLAAGWMRRYAAVLRHRAAGAAANVMVAWRVPAGRADEAGALAAAVGAVSHCYLRPEGPDWPYTLYTMIHGRSRDDCARAVAQVAHAAGLSQRAELWTEAEYAKRRVRLFDEAEASWERAAAGP